MKGDYQEKTIRKALKATNLIVDEGLSTREAAARLGYKKSIVHWYIHNPIKELHPELYKKAVDVLEKNWLYKHLRGGESTRRRYEAARYWQNVK